MASIAIRIAKADKNVNVDVSKFSQAVMDHIVYNGISFLLNGATGQFKVDEENLADKSIAAVEKKLEKLYNGVVGSRRETDPVVQEAIRIAMDILKDTSAYRKTSYKELRAAALKIYEDHLDEAQEIIDIKAAAAERRAAKLAAIQVKPSVVREQVEEKAAPFKVSRKNNKNKAEQPSA